jgi:hypothetical protein
MNATIGAQGVLAASVPRTTAVVPQEQNGVRVASRTAPVIALHRRRRPERTGDVDDVAQVLGHHRRDERPC